jgi:hypothetical protein
MRYEELPEEELREIAKERKIANWHNRRVEGIIELLRQRDETTGDWQPPDNSLPKLSWSQIIDTLDSRAISTLSDALEALDRLANPQAKDFIVWFSSWQAGTYQANMPLTSLHAAYCREYSQVSLNYFRRLVEDVCVLHKGVGWRVSDDHLVFTKKASFPLSWHVDVWKTSKIVDNATTATRVMTLLLGGGDD